MTDACSTPSIRRLGPRWWACALTLVLAVSACEWEGYDRVQPPNERPTIRITGGATEGGNADYRVEFFWFGSDADGVVSFFQHAIDDTCLCTYEVETQVFVPESDTTIIVTETVEADDPDSCRIRGIEPAYTSVDSIWKRIDAYSGTFEFSASTPIGGSPPLATDWHRFFIRAIDDRGGVSEPDIRYFNAQTIAPTVRILSPLGRGYEKSRTVSPFVTVRWSGRDEDSTHPNNKPRGYQLKMVQLDNIFEAEDLVLRYLTSQFISRPNTLIPETLLVETEDERGPETFYETDWWPKAGAPYEFETLKLENLVPDNYALAIRAVDQAGAVMPDEAHRLCSEAIAGSVVKLDVSSTVPVRPFIEIDERNILGEHVFVGDGEVWRVEVPVNTPLRFDWTVDASHYGARPAGTNYALDISDPGCEVCQESDGIGGWIGWGTYPGMLSDIRFTDDQAGEQHVLYVRARDESFREDRETLALVVMDVVGFSFDRPALWVDDFKSTGIDDCTHDTFVRSILEPGLEPFLEAGEELDQFIARRPAGECQESSAPTLPKLSTMSRYRTIYWAAAAAGGGTALGGVTDPGPEARAGRYLSIYVRAGGSLLVWGRDTAGAMLGDFYTQDAPYTPDLPIFPEPNFGPGTFLWDTLRMRTRLDVVGRGSSRTLRNTCSGIIGMEVTPEAEAEGYPAGRTDPTGYDPTRTAIWFDQWHGAENPWGALGANGFLGHPSLRVAGMDTLYTYVSNSWSYEQGGAIALREACGTAFLSPFERNPVAVRFRDPFGFQGRTAWILTPLHVFRADHHADLVELMSHLTRWLFVVE